GIIKYTHTLNEKTKLYAGADVSNVTLKDGKKTAETNGLAGIQHTSGAWSFDAGLIYHWFPGADKNLEMNYIELKGQAAYDFKVASLTGAVKYSPSGSGDIGATYYPSLTLKVPLPHDLTASATTAYMFVQDNAAFRKPDYAEWGNGLSYKTSSDWEFS